MVPRIGSPSNFRRRPISGKEMLKRLESPPGGVTDSTSKSPDPSLNTLKKIKEVFSGGLPLARTAAYISGVTLPTERKVTSKELKEHRRKAERTIRRAERTFRQTVRGHEASAADLLRRAVIKAFAALLVFWFISPPFVAPVEGRVTSGYFVRVAPEARFWPQLEFHSGTDFAAPVGTPVRAAKSGRIVQAGYNDLAGNHVEVRHFFGFSTFYAHLDRMDVRRGGFVFKGSRIGTVGTSGRATGPHVHFEVRLLGHPVPPGVFLVIDTTRRTIWRAVTGR